MRAGDTWSRRGFLTGFAAYVGLDPQKDIRFVTPPIEDSARMLAAGEIDAVVAFPPVSQELRERKIGHVVVDSRVDEPWSQYFCCLLTANQEFILFGFCSLAHVW